MDMAQGILHGSLHCGNGDEVDMIRHEAVRQYFKAIAPTVAMEQSQVRLAIRI